MDPLRILFILPEGDPPLAPLAALLREAGHLVQMAPTERAAELLSGPEPFDVVIRAPGDEVTAPSPLEQAERRHIAATLQHTRGNKRQAAHLLGIARSTLLAKVRKYEL